MKIVTKITRTIEDDLPITSSGTRTVGKFVEDVIRTHVEQDETVGSITLTFDDADWELLSGYFSPKSTSVEAPKSKAAQRFK